MGLTTSEILENHCFVLFLRVLKRDFGLLISDANTVDDTSQTVGPFMSNGTYYHATLSD